MTFSSVGPQSGASQTVGGSSLPASPTPRQIFTKTSGGSEGLYVSVIAGSWVGPLGTGSGTVTSVSGTANQISVANPTTTPTLSFPSGPIISENFVSGLTSTATAAGTTTLTVDSKGIQVFTGSTTQIVVLPVVSTLPQVGFGFVIQNDSSGALTVNSSGGNLVQTIAAGARATFTCKLLTGTTAASWNVDSKANLAGGNTFTGTQIFGAVTVTNVTGAVITSSITRQTNSATDISGGPTTDAASNVAINLRSYRTFSTTGAKIVSFQNNTSEVAYVDKDGGFTNASPTANTGGGYQRAISEATVTLSGASGSIAVNIPVGARLLGVQLRVDTLITSGDGGTTWAAAYAGGSTQAITTGQAFTKNTKVNTMFDSFAATPIVAGSVATITITPNAGTFSAGAVRAVVYYENFVALSNNP